MSEPLDFNPYYKWLSVPKNILRPNYYQLLGLAMFETNTEIISMAGKVALMKLDRIPLDDPHADLVPRLQALIEFATDTLCDEEKHREYDQWLKQKITDYIKQKKATDEAKSQSPKSPQATQGKGQAHATDVQHSQPPHAKSATPAESKRSLPTSEPSATMGASSSAKSSAEPLDDDAPLRDT